jgi:signal transduction histidine kinase/CheY-like chemotaxis protein
MSEKKEKINNMCNESDFIALTNRLLTRFISSPIEEVESILLSALHEVCDFFLVDEVFIILFDQSTNEWHLAYKWSALPESQTADITKILSAGTLAWSQKKLLAQQEIKIDDLSNISFEAKNDFDTLSVNGLKSILTEPIFGKATSIQGCVGMCTYSQPHTWNKAESQNFIYFSNIIANILGSLQAQQDRNKHESFIELANLFIQISLELNSIETALQRISEHLQNFTGNDFCGFSIWDEEQKLSIPIAATGKFSHDFLNSKGLQEQPDFPDCQIEKDFPFAVNQMNQEVDSDCSIVQVQPFSSLLCIRLRSESAPLGVMFLGYEKKHTFSQEEIRCAKLVATQISLMLNKMLLYQKTQQQIEELNAISEISNSLRNAQTLSEIPDIVINKVIEICKVENAALIVADSTQNTPYFFQGRIFEKKFSLAEFLDRYQPIQELVLTRKNPTNDPSGSSSHSIEFHKSETDEYVIAFPMITHNQSMGVFCVSAKSIFTHDKKRILSAVTNLVANAIYRQSLVDNLQIQLEILRKTRMQLVQSEKLAAIGELVAGVAHELNNPLTTISLWAELLHQQSISEQDRYDLSKIISESHRAASIVQSLLDFSRQHPPERKPVDLNLLIKSTIEMAVFELNKNSITCRLNLDPQLPLTVADPYQIKQVFLNLVNNSIQAIGANQKTGTITITSEIGPTKYFNQMGSPKMLRVIIEDNGAGIPPELFPRIFDPFFTTKPEGTGLGLSVCHGIITEHGGNIWAESGNNGGTKLFVELPIETPVNKSGNTEISPTKFTSKNLAHILIIEDEPAVLEVMQRALMRKGYYVEGTKNALDALDVLKTQTYDLIICDIHMPQMNGIEFFSEISKSSPKLVNRVIFTSGDTISRENLNFIKLAHADLLPKPFELEKLISTVQKKLTQANSEF